MNAIDTTAQTLMVNINEGYPLFKAVDPEQARLLRQTGEWASYLFKTIKYRLEGTAVTLYHVSPATGVDISPYFKPSTEQLKKLVECMALITPARVVASSLKADKGVYFTHRNFDSNTTRPRSVGIFMPLLDGEEVDETHNKTVIDLKDVSPSELDGYFQDEGYPTGVNLYDFFEVERDHVVSFIRQIRQSVMH